AGFLTYLKTAYPKIAPPQEIKIESTAQLVARGSYLANHVCLCVDCHSQRDWTKYCAPLVQGTIGQGGEAFDQKFGFPGAFYSKNITPYHLANWTDGEIYRTITTGVNRDGKALFPLMPYLNYGKLDPNDVKAIIAYIRTLPSVSKDVPESKADFPMNFIINTIPTEAKPQSIPAKTDKVAYGFYMINAADCRECHTKQDKGKEVGEPFAGGFEFNMPNGTVIRSANITTDKETGIGAWTKEMFIKKFKMFADSNYHCPTVQPGQTNTIMPWDNYAGMDSTDLDAIFAYLQTVKPVKNQVLHFSPAK
ncbi:MAG TPA: cytochrome C, partial [Bacteroidia bacterium]|nr:cytochrome C [Bacteroidia bacterium]